MGLQENMGDAQMNGSTITLLGCCAALVFSSPALAAPVVWTLQDVIFTDGGTASGSFTFDADANAVTAFSISVAGGNISTFPAFTWADDESFPIVFISPPTGNTVFEFKNVDDENPFSRARTLRIAPETALTDAGGTIALDINEPFSADCFDCIPFRRLAGGSVTAAALAGVPEPMTWSMMILGLLGSGTVLRRRRVSFATQLG